MEAAIATWATSIPWINDQAGKKKNALHGESTLARHVADEIIGHVDPLFSANEDRLTRLEDYRTPPWWVSWPDNAPVRENEAVIRHTKVVRRSLEVLWFEI